MFSDDTAISLEGISKRYYLRSQRPVDLKTTLLHLPSFLWRDSNRKAFWALDGVSFSVARGESIGIIGPNGSGKSTLLKIVADLARPTQGKIAVNGRISALLELGAGFHPQITGRQNAVLNAVLLGLSRREAEEALPDIIAFSELGDFIDEPMRTYSSGMYIRLGFSVAVHVHADVLLVDEVLAVGDAEFQQKCFDHIEKLRAKGVTIVLVSHDLGSVTRFCERAVLLHHGRVQVEGKSQPVVHEYLSRIAAVLGHAVSS
jgi:ABC-2 type transport system ATP-binding protein/lipopolysaccharide transport system ATP-binding protein